MHKAILALALASILVAGFALPNAFAQTKKGPYADELHFIHYENENVALEEVRSGGLDAYYFKIPLEVADDVRDNSRVKIYERIAGSNGMHKVVH